MFDDGRTFEADVIVLATGYTQSFPFLEDGIREDHRCDAQAQSGGSSNETTTSEFLLKEDYLPSENFITSKKRPKLRFIWFRPAQC